MELDIIKNSPLQEEDEIEMIIYLCSGEGLKININPFIEAQSLHDIICEELNIELDSMNTAMAIWMVSPLIEIQLKNHHIPYVIRLNWKKLLKKFTNTSEEIMNIDEPIILFKRNIYFSTNMEKNISNTRLLQLLYEEALENFANNIYVCDEKSIVRLSTISILIKQLKIGISDLGLPNKLINIIPEFSKYIWSTKNSFCDFLKPKENRLECQIFKEYQVLQSTRSKFGINQLYKDFLTACHSIAFYGCAFFDAFIEKCSDKKHNGDLSSIIIALNTKSLIVFDGKEKVILMNLHYSDFSWDLAEIELPNTSNQTASALFIQVKEDIIPDCHEGGNCDNKIFVLYSKQAPLMDAIITTNAEILKGALNLKDAMDSTKRIETNKTMCTYSPKLKEYVCFKLDSKDEVIVE